MIQNNPFIQLFFVPDKIIYDTPENYGFRYEEIFFSSTNGNKLHGLLFKSKKPAKATLIHCHGNAANVTNHFPGILFLVKAGYNVFTFDYSGYGQSEGKPSPGAIIEDAEGAIAEMKNHKEIDPHRLGVFGQSLGGAAATAVMAKDPSLKCLALEGAFTTYRAMAWNTALGRLLFFLTPFVIPHQGPLTSIKKVAPRPVLILHGTDDNLIPVKFAAQLYEAAHHKKTLSIIQGLHHLHGEEAEDEYQKTILTFFDTQFAD